MKQIKTRQELIKLYLDFYKSKNHKIIPSASLIPENDPTVLFTTAGMHPLVPFLLGQKHPLGKRIANVQKCIRTQDIDDVGDPTHNTFFEMMGNWSMGDYWKEDAIKFTFEFHTKVLGIPLEKYAVSVFKGDKQLKEVPIDEESVKIWLKLGIPKERIAYLEKNDNWWGPAGEFGPCGPDTEQFFYTGKEPSPKTFDPKNKNWVEIGNDVLMEYNKTKKGYEKASQKNVDFGGGVERTLAVLNGLDDVYLTTIFQPIIKEIEKLANKKYSNEENKKAMRIIADHIRAATFILGDPRSIKPTNAGQGYVLRRLIRRAVRYGKLLGINDNFTGKIALSVITVYNDYHELIENKSFIIEQLNEEENKFNKTLNEGLKKFKGISKGKKEITGKDAFLLFQSYGFPIEMTQELANENNLKVNLKEYEKEYEKHQELSRTASSGMFKSGLADHSEQTKKLHTATHLLNESLRIVLGNEVKQKGSNINPERLRFDFNFPRKLTEQEIEKIENLVNKKIKESLNVIREEMPLDKAIKSGAQSEFGMKYPEVVSVYTIIDKKDRKGWFSKEICTGPHVKNTKEIGHFKILKEESSAAGIRRIKAIV
ncbi:MAG TPA: alanine--tRNA ligase [Candidatus Nanoarchaeia archaeon]|nr:alanine--tRNA ligase [Candidatus Nanoarchaeia archaeon]